jgi:adenine-specific DNA-methyltransferase
MPIRQAERGIRRPRSGETEQDGTVHTSEGHTSEGLAALIEAAFALGADQVPGLSAAEKELTAAMSTATHPAASGSAPAAADLRELIAAGGDPLGDALCAARTSAERRGLGQTLTPGPIVHAMIDWAAGQATAPARVIDPGTGSGRFLLAAGRRWRRAELVGVETDPAAAIVARGNLAAAGLAGRAKVINADYRALRLPPAGGPTLFLGNPPYVRHHQISPEWKRWFTRTARERDLTASVLAGLHVHFFLATAGYTVPGDLGAFITAAEWLDVNYGGLVRSLLLGDLGGQAVHVFEPTAPVFADAIVTSAITCFQPGTRAAAVRLKLASGIAELGGGTPVARARLTQARRWGPLVRDPGRTGLQRPGNGVVELGEICRVHRGQVTGANAVWVRDQAENGVPHRFRYPAVTRARELFAAGGVLAEATSLRVVIDLPADLDGLTAAEQEQVRAFIAGAARLGAAGSYIARHRRPWWRVGLIAPAPILASYMARRPPAFVINPIGARHLNIAHGLYPRDPLPQQLLERLAAYLRDSVTLGQGRTYAGGLTKFEPREMERIPVPWDELRSSC